MKSKTKRYLISALVGFGTSVIYLLFPLYAESLGAGSELIGTIVSIYAASSALTFYLAGRYSDSQALRKSLISAGLLAMTGGAVFHYIASSISLLALARVIYGLGFGLYTGPMIAYVGGKGSRSQMGSFLGFYSLGMGIGIFLGGYLAKIFSFNFLFSVFGIPVFLAFLVSLTISKEDISKVSISLIPVDLIKRNSKMFSSFLLRNLTAHGVWMLMPLYVGALGGDASFVSLLFGVNSLVQVIVMNTVTRVGIEETRLIKFGFVASLAVFLLIALTPSLHFLIFVFLLLGTAWGTLYVGSTNYLVHNNKEKATVAGLLQSSRSMGIIAGPFLAGILTSFVGFRKTILLISILAAIAMFIGLKIKE